MRIDRMLAMTVMLLNREIVSAREMAGRFGVSVRTIYRDLEAMNLAGIPVVAYQGAGGGFALVENYTIDRQLLSFEGMVSILTALTGLNTTLDDRTLGETIEKLSALVPKNRRSEAESLMNRFIVDLSPWGMSERQKVRVSTIQTALAQSRRLSFEYQGSSTQRSRRTVEPVTLVFKGHSFYLYAFCLMRSAFRLFRVSRMRELTIESGTYKRRDASYAEMEQKTSSGPEVEFTVKFSPRIRALAEDQFDESEGELQDDGSLVVTFTLPEDEWVYGMILSYGPDAEILRPERVRGIIAERAKKIVSLYEHDTTVSRRCGTIHENTIGGTRYE